MAKKKDLFEMPKAFKEIDFKKLQEMIASKEDFATLGDMNAYIRIVNKPVTKNLKVESGPDFNTGELGDPVLLTTDSGWAYAYHIPKGKSGAWVEMAADRYQDSPVYEEVILKSTHQAKTFRSAVELVDFLIGQGWQKFAIEEGSDALSWAVWAYLTHLGKPVTGYKPTDFDQMRLDNSKDLFASVQKSVQELVNTTSFGPVTISTVSSDSAKDDSES